MMVLSRTPFRMSLFGGGTDYPEHFETHSGCTLSTTINKYCYISVSSLQDFFDYKIRVTYSKTELVDRVDDLRHPAVRECLRFLGLSEGLEIHYTADLPARSGLGSSSCFTVGLLNALHAFLGEDIDAAQIAAEAVHVERDLIGERVGLQDQYSCAVGGLLRLSYHPDLSIDIDPVALPSESLEALHARLMMFYTGLQRYAHEVLESQIEETRRGNLADDLRILGGMVPTALDVLRNGGDLGRVGRMLDRSWQVKRGLSAKVSNEFIDDCYRRACEAGALGGKIMGAGGGGFLLMFAEPRDHQRVRDALRDLPEVRFDFEGDGTRIVYRESRGFRPIPARESR